MSPRSLLSRPFLPIAILTVAAPFTSSLAQTGSTTAPALAAGSVDFQKIQRHYYRVEQERRSIQERTEQEAGKLEKTVDDTRSKVEALLEEQQKAQADLQDPTFSETKKQEILAEAQERAGQINALQRELLELQAQARTTLAREASEANAAILREINDAIRVVAEEQGVDFVMNRSFGVSGIATFPYISARHVVDLTDDVIGKLNQNAPEGWTPGATPAED